jgi:hypothetical protein
MSLRDGAFPSKQSAHDKREIASQRTLAMTCSEKFLKRACEKNAGHAERSEASAKRGICFGNEDRETEFFS